METQDLEAIMARLASIESLLQHVLAELQSQRARAELKDPLAVGPRRLASSVLRVVEVGQ